MKNSVSARESAKLNFNRFPVFRMLIPSLVVILLAMIIPVNAAPDFELNVNIPLAVDTAHPSIATVTVTSVYQFTGTINLSENSTQGLSCNPINPNSITLDSVTVSGNAILSCRTSTPGLYNVTVTAVSGTLPPHYTRYTANFTAAPPSPQAATILGLSPQVYGAIVGIGTATLIVSYIGLKKRRIARREPAPSKDIGTLLVNLMAFPKGNVLYGPGSLRLQSTQ